MAATRLSAGRFRFICLVEFVLCSFLLFTAGNSAAMETGGPQRIDHLTTSHSRYQKLELVKSEQLRAPRSSRHIHKNGAHNGESSGSWSIFRDADYGDNKVIVVSADSPVADFTSIQDAVNHVPDNNPKRTIIYITSGVYEEKVIIPITKPHITLQGEGRNRTVITWNDTADAAGRTLMSATVVVDADHFIARDISFKNSAGPPLPTRLNMQAVAFRISGDMAVLYMCNFFGFQDTLYDHAGRHYYDSCFIQGTEDFIFGFGRSLFERCWLHSIANDGSGALVAQGKYYPGISMGPSGFSFLRCIITGSGRPYLGRAWGEFSTVVYSYCEMDADINPKGWYDWGVPERERTAYFGQYRCSGRGANTTDRVSWAKELTSEEAEPYLGIQYIDGPW